MTSATTRTPSPLPPPDSTTAPAIDSVIYQLHGSRVLRTFEARKCVKDVVLCPHKLKQFHKFLRTSRGYLSIMYATGYICGMTVFFVPAKVGGWLAVANFVLGIPPHITTYLVLRYDLIVLICTTFEFWYVTVVNVVCLGLLIASYHDWRGLMAFWSAFGFEIAFFMDAVHRSTTITVVAVVMGAIGEMLFMVTTAFDIVDGARHSVLYENGTLRLTADDVILNGVGTIVVLLLRNAYRKYKTHKSTDSQQLQQLLGGSCIMYRCRLELRPIAAMSAISPTAADPSSQPPATTATNPSRIQLICASSTKTFDGQVVMMPRRLCTVSKHPWSRSTHTSLWLVALISQVSLVLSNPILTAWLPHSLATIVAWLSITTATVFCGVYFAHCQRQLLLDELCGSFDFLFMSFQFTVAHWCICDMLQWNVIQCLGGVLSSWLWSHWLITLDAVAPVMKRKLGFHARGAICVDVVLLLQQLILACTLFSSNTAVYTDHLLFVAQFYGHTKEFRAVPVFVWRNFTCFLWCARLLWRLVDRKGDELLVLQGQVQYEDASRGKGEGARARQVDLQAIVPFDGQ